MELTICEDPFTVSLVGFRGELTEDIKCYGTLGCKLMGRMWEAVAELNLPHHGINHWVYLDGGDLFCGTELKQPAEAIGELERMDVVLPRYSKCLLVGSYTQLGETWQFCKEELERRGETQGFPSLEIYDHHDDVSADDHRTTILMRLQ